jgi:hypothetical protein
MERPAAFRYALPFLLALALLLMFAAGAARADVYRWTDAQGRVHYSDVPVEGAVLIKSTAPARQFEPSAPSPAPSPAVERPAVGTANPANRLADEAMRREIQKDVDQKRSAQCKEAMERYDKSVAARRIYRDGKNGERVYLTEAELGEARLEAKKTRDESCGASAGLK